MVRFGTGGWRAIIGEGFTKENLQKLAYAMILKMEKERVAKKGMVIGYDRRFLSKEAVCWLCEVFAAKGIEVKFINRSSPTPLIMYYVMKHGYPYGMMVTASHNPAIYNGVKVFTAEGRDANEDETKDMERYIDQVEEQCADGYRIETLEYQKALESGLVTEFNPLNEYIDNIVDTIDTKAIRDRQLHVVLDPMYGVSQTSLRTILSIARCEVDVIHEDHDTLFGGKLPSPSAARLKSLRNFVMDKHCDIGIATDGDADRIGVIDDQGDYLHPNDILVLLYYYLLKYKGWKGDVVRNTGTTHTLDKVAKAFGQKCHEVPMGFKYVSAKMEEVDAIIGGESSGGMTVRGHIHGKDGIYAAALLVEMIAMSKKRLSELQEEIKHEFGARYMVERDFKVSQEKKENIYQMMIEEKQLPKIPYEIDVVSYMDGCKVYLKNGGWFIARFSGTEPLIRFFCEMNTQEEAKKWCDQYEEFLGL